MTITRRGLADEIDRIDEQIAEWQKDKSEIYHAYREQLENSEIGKTAVKAEIAALKLAIRRRRESSKDPDAVAERDALLDEILHEIRAGTDRATRARTHAPRARETDKLPAESMTAGKGARPAGEASTHEPASTDTPAGLVSSSPSHGNSDGMDIPAFLARGGEFTGGKVLT